MDAKLRQISQLLKRYDSALYPKRALDGTMTINRKRRGWDFYRFPNFVFWHSLDFDDLVFPCTDNWHVHGTPVDWGIEPIFWEVQKLDGWRDDGDYDRFCEERLRKAADKERSRNNEMRALAADSRRDFARATNDINTSIIEKVDKRRKYDGYRR